MFNPLVDNLSELKDNELEDKIVDLQRKYFQSHNPQVQDQIVNILEMYRQELFVRQQIAAQKQRDQQNGENGLDNLINVS